MALRFMDDISLLRVDLVLKHIDEVLNDVDGISLDTLRKSSLLLRAVSFSLAQIGEQMNQLEKIFGEKYPNLPWKNARVMRNIIVHDYGRADVDQIYSTITNDLPALKTAFIEIENNETKS